MADDLKAIVQRMIDAGESEDNIATVIQSQSGTSIPASEPGGLSMAKHLAAGPGTQTPEEGPGLLARIVGRIQNPSAGEQLGMDVLPFAQGAIGRMVRGGPAPERLSGVGTGMKAGARVLAEDIPLVRKYGPAVEAFQKARTPAAPPEVNPNDVGLYQHMESLPMNRPAPIRGRLAMPPPQMEPAAKLKLSAPDILKLQALVSQGVPETEAVRVLTSMKSGTARVRGRMLD